MDVLSKLKQLKEYYASEECKREDEKQILSPIWEDFVNLDPSSKSVAALPKCPKSCEHCTAQYLLQFPYKEGDLAPIEIHDDKQAASEIAGLMSKVHGNLAYMNEKIENYGSTMAKRWTKVFKEKKREALLLQAKPNLHPRKYAAPDLIFGRSDISGEVDMKTLRRLQYYCALPHEEIAIHPYLDLPSLVEDKSKLLCLIHYRATSSPSDWILFDWQQARIFGVPWGLWRAYNPHAVVSHGADFGKLVQWSKASAHKREAIGYPAARLALKAQAQLTDFLRRMIDLILEGDLSGATRGREGWDARAAESFTMQSLEHPVSAYFESPFGPPPCFDADHLATVFQARLRAVEDDLRLLQTDPIQFLNIVDHTIATVQRKSMDIKRVESFIVGVTLRGPAKLPMLRWMLRKLEQLSSLKQQACRNGESISGLSEEYWGTLRILEQTMKAAMRSEIQRVGWMITASPALHDDIRVLSGGDQSRSDQCLFFNHPLLWNVSELSDFDRWKSFPLSFHLASIDELLATSSKKDSARINQALYDWLSDLAAVAEGLAAIKYHKHFAPSGHFDQLGEQPKVGVRLPVFAVNHLGKTECTGLYQKYVTELPKHEEEIWRKLEQLRNMSKPSSDITEENVARIKAMHEALDDFWRQVRESKTPMLQPIIPKAEFEEYIQDLSMGLDKQFKAQMDEEWEESLQIIRTKEISTIESRKADSCAPFLPTAQSIRHDTATSMIVPTETRTKIKTRPMEQCAQSDSSYIINATKSLNVNEEPEKRALDQKSSLTVFERMFTRSSAKYGATKWSEFVGALKDAGLSATYNGGSGVMFSDKRTHKGAVGFHKPHPDSSIPLEWLREMGKRLNKWFGWGGDSFFVRSKKDT